MIRFREVTYRYRDDAPPALSDVTLSFVPGELVVVVGANGSGKSTLAKLSDGLLWPTAGEVTVDGLDTTDPATLWDVRSRVGVVFQDPDDQIVGTVVEDDCAFGPENLGVEPRLIRERVDAALAAVGLSGLERREPHLLSEGQKQRLAVAGALAMGPGYLVLDEPMAMLDSAGRRSVLAILERLAHVEGHGVVLVSHDASALGRADRVVGLAEGRVLFDGPASEVLGDPGLLRELGLALPPAGVLAGELRALGCAVPPAALEAETIVGALWP